MTRLSRRSFLGSMFAARPPNILLIQTDDQRFDAVGYANPLVQTPNIDAVARSGIRFTNSFVTTSVCSASRAALLTGRYGSCNGVPGLGGGLRSGETTFIPSLKQAGYRTGHIGKWHLGPPATPSAAGFDHDIHFISNGPHFDRKVTVAGKQVAATGFIEDFLAARAVEFLDRSAGRGEPFFLTLATQVPHMDNHDEWLPREETLARYRAADIPLPRSWDDSLDGKPAYLRTCRHRERGAQFGYRDPAKLKEHIRRYWAAITDLDQSLGSVFRALDRLKLRGNTVIIFTGDNGWFLGEHGFSSKVLPYEESIRVPLFIAGPGIRPRSEQALMLNVDIAPAILDFAGLRAASRMMHGFAPGRKPPRDGFLYEAMTPTLGSWPLLAYRDRRWKYIQTFDPAGGIDPVFEELYDLASDREELLNVAPGHDIGRFRERLSLARHLCHA